MQRVQYAGIHLERNDVPEITPADVPFSLHHGTPDYLIYIGDKLFGYIHLDTQSATVTTTKSKETELRLAVKSGGMTEECIPALFRYIDEHKLSNRESAALAYAVHEAAERLLVPISYDTASYRELANISAKMKFLSNDYLGEEQALVRDLRDKYLNQNLVEFKPAPRQPWRKRMEYCQHEERAGGADIVPFER